MTPPEIENQIVEAISRRPPSVKDAWILCISDNHLQLVEVEHYISRNIDFGCITNDEAKCGMHISRWNELTRKIVNYCKQTGKELEPWKKP